MIWSMNVGEKVEHLEPLVAAWVTPRDDDVQTLLHESAKNDNAVVIGGVLGYQNTQHRREVKDTVSIPPGNRATTELHLTQDAEVRGTLTQVTGGSGNDVDFALLSSAEMVEFSGSPSSATSRRKLQRVSGSHIFRFIAPAESDYYMLLDNSFSGFSRKTVAYSLHLVTQLSHQEIVAYQLKAIYETIQKRGFSYVNTPISYAPGASQRVKRPAETIRMKGGNCIDMTVLFASLFEAVGFDVNVVLLPAHGHSVVTVRNWSDEDGFIPVETTVVGAASFGEAVRLGQRALDEETNALWISVADCRMKRIMPFS